MASNRTSNALPDERPLLPSDDHSISVGRDASGNAFITGNQNHVTVIVYQSVSERRETVIETKSYFGPNPYMGLQAFHEEDADRFFGRELQIDRLWNKLRDLEDASLLEGSPRLLPILGPSGSGKSSLARAGLIPELARRPYPDRRNVRVAVLTPGSHPVEALAAVLARIATGDPTPVEKTREFERFLSNRNEEGYDGLRRISDILPESASIPLILLVDQFEEVYSLCKDEDQREVFVDNLMLAACDAGRRASVVITLRTDFLGETQQHEALNRVICEHQVMIPAMSESELRAAIAKPAELAGHPLNEATITLLMSETKNRVGALPLLQFALKRIWLGMTQNVPEIQTLNEIGGVGGALAGEAKRIFNGLGNKEQQIAKRVFLNLVQLGEGTRDTRRRAPLASLVTLDETEESVRRVIDRFSDRNARLITLSADEAGSGDMAEVTHEALFDHWKELNDWLDQNRDDLRFQRRLDEQINLWQKEKKKPDGQPKGLLWRPPELTLLQNYRDRVVSMTGLQAEFYLESDKAERMRIATEKVQLRRLLLLASGLAIAALFACGLLVVTVFSLSAAKRSHANAIASQIENLQSAQAIAAPSILENLNVLAETDKQVVVVMQDKRRTVKDPTQIARLQLGLLVVAGQKQELTALTSTMLKPSLNLDEYFFLRDQLTKFSEVESSSDLWNLLLLESPESTAWLRIAGALAKFDPKNKQWEQIGPDLVEQLVRQEPTILKKWIAGVDTVRTHLVRRLEEIFESQESERASLRANAALLLSEYLSNDPIRLAELIIKHANTPETFRPLVTRLPRAPLEPGRRAFRSDENLAREKVVDVVNETLAEHLLKLSEETESDCERQRRRQANAAMIFLFIGEEDNLWPLLESSDSPTLRTYLIHRFQLLGVEPERFYTKLMDARTPKSARLALVLALGEYSPYPIASGELTTNVNHLLNLYQNDPDPGIHSAAEWTLNQWSRDSRLKGIAVKMRTLRQQWSVAHAPSSRDHFWYVNSTKHTMLIMRAPEGEIEVGSAETEIGRDSNEQIAKLKISKSFAIASTEVTNEQFSRFLVATSVDPWLQRELGITRNEAESLEREMARKNPSMPVTNISWYQAATYCNWLTIQEFSGGELCYSIGPKSPATEGWWTVGPLGRHWGAPSISASGRKSEVDGTETRPLYMAALSTSLRTGYRLPTELEWEYACRASAKANSRWSQSELEELLGKYANYDNQSVTVAGSLKSNDFGLFDMHGNVWEWCHPTAVNTDEHFPVDRDAHPSLRGGAYSNWKNSVRSAIRVSSSSPDKSESTFGFRVARTFP